MGLVQSRVSASQCFFFLFLFLPNISSFHHFFLSIYLSFFLSLFSNTLHKDVISWQEGGLAQMVERSLSMREVPGSIPGSSMSFFHQHQIENQPLFSQLTRNRAVVRMAERSKALR